MLPSKPFILVAFAVATIVLGDDDLICDTDYTKNGTWCYKLMDAADNFKIASQTCMDEGGNLTSIHSEEENAFIASFGVNVEIGLLYNSRSRNYSWTDGTPVDVQLWAPNYPMDARHFGECVILHKSGKWKNFECNWKSQYVCKKEPSSHQCPAPPNNMFLDKGEVASPSYPGKYLNGLSCMYMLVVENGHRVILNKTVNQMGSEDTIEIFSGLEDDTNYLISKIEGSKNDGPVEFITPQGENEMLLKFTSKSKTGGFWKFDFRSSGECEDGWSYGGENGLDNCYILDKRGESFSYANEICQRVGAQLISIQNTFQNKYIQGEIEKAGVDRIWLGFRYDGKNWKWLDGSVSPYTNWDYGEPKNYGQYYCSRMGSNGKWSSIECNSYGATMCYKP